MKTLQTIGPKAAPMPDTAGLPDDDSTPTERVFAHWVFMLGRNAKRCALGPARRKVIDRALVLYDEDTLLLAVEGCAASAWHAGDNDRGRPFNDIELILRDEAHVERFAADGEALRTRLLRRQAHADEAAKVVPIVPADPAAIAAQRQALAAMAAELRARRGVRHG
jgi:hypothetical protein